MAQTLAGIFVGSDSEDDVGDRALLAGIHVDADSEDDAGSRDPLAGIHVDADSEADGDARGGIDVEDSSDGSEAISRLPSTPQPPGRGRGWRRKSVDEVLSTSKLDGDVRKRLRRARENELRKAAIQETGQLATNLALDNTRLHAGDTVTDGAQGSKHANTWRPQAVVKLAMESLGQSSTSTSRSLTHNSHTASECVAWCATKRWEQIIEDFLRQPPKDFLYLERAFDASPLDLELAELAERLFRIARFRYLEGGRWTLIQHEQAQQLKLKCKRGIVEMLAQTIRIAWKEDASYTESRAPPDAMLRRLEKVICRPLFIEAASASNELQAANRPPPSPLPFPPPPTHPPPPPYSPPSPLPGVGFVHRDRL